MSNASYLLQQPAVLFFLGYNLMTKHCSLPISCIPTAFLNVQGVEQVFVCTI
jgi:hypothetical protein